MEAVETIEETVLLGDVNLDGSVSFLDISPFIAFLSGGGFQAEADIDENGVNFLDISPFIAILSDINRSPVYPRQRTKLLLA